MSELTTWRKEFLEIGINPDELSITIKDGGLDVEFDNGCGGTEGPVFTAWSNDRVYFPACYDGSEWIASVPRNPCVEKTDHVGGS